MIIIRIPMDNHRFPDNLSHTEPVSKHFHICFPVISQQGWQISCMVRVGCTSGIPMIAGIRKSIACAAVTLVDMERKIPGL